MRLAAHLLLFAALALPGAGVLTAQGAAGVRLAVALTPDAGRPNGKLPEARVSGLLEDDRWTSALLSGLPLRLHYRLELWRSRSSWFDAAVRSVEWDVVVRREPLLDQYTVTTVLLGRTRQQRYPDLGALGSALGVAYRIAVRPSDPGEYYYVATLSVSTLSDADLDEMDRVMRGETGAATDDNGNVGDAVGRTARRMLLRVAGLPIMRVDGRSESFRIK
ncbi:MAG TPA: DUF4390 domain-containing protein [Gemmatimonadales bacterium]|nr:DUF4390 domain-containing protein [Gemmatimonadales bacterium]